MPDAIQPTTQRNATGSRWRLPLAVFALLTAGTLAAWNWQYRTQLEALDATAMRDSAAHTAELRNRLKLHAQFLKSLSAFATANPMQDLESWQRYAREIEFAHNLNGLSGFAYAPFVPPEAQASVTAGLRRQLKRPDFAIHPPPGGKPAAPVVFLTSAAAAQQGAQGFDLLSENNRREAIETAVASRDIAMSGRITMFVDRQSQRAAFLLVHALYRPGQPLDRVEERQRAFAGVVVTAYRTEEFFHSLNLGSGSQFALQIFDEGSNSRQAIAQPAALIFDSAPDYRPSANAHIYHHEIDFGGRNWVLHYRLQGDRNSSQGLDAATLILIGGLTGSALLALLVFHLTTHRARAQHYAHRLTAELQHAAERMRLATAATHDGLWDQDLVSGEDYISGRMAEIFGFPRELPPQQMSLYVDRIHPEDIERRNAALRRHLRENRPFDIELRIEKVGDGEIWIRVRGEAVRNAAGKAVRIAGAVSDITASKQAEARLERLRRLLVTSIAATPLPVFVQDARRKLQMVNTAFCELLDRPEAELLTGFWPDFPGIAADDRRRLIGAAERALSSGHGEPIEFELQAAKLGQRQLIARIAQAQNPEGEPFLITTLTDVTELRRAASAIRAADLMKQAVLDAATEVSIIATDPDGLITIFNRGAEKMLGYSAGEMVGKQTPLYLHLPEEIATRAAELSERLGRPIDGFEVFAALPRSGRPEQHDTTYVCKDGERLNVNLVVTAQRDIGGQISGYLGIAIDVTAQKRSERELAVHRDHLQELVAERTRRLDVALHEAQAASIAKSEFLANMSHELRTPMHAILSFAELGEDRAEVAAEARLAQYFNRIAQSARRLLGLINDLLDLAKLEAGRNELVLAPVDVLALLRQTSSHLESLMQGRKLQLQISSATLDTDLLGDPRRIAQILHNLLSNAIKFSPDGGTISVHLSASELAIQGTTAPALAICFNDNGIGIPESELESIFDKFVQSSATKTGAGGSGLGLAICRELVHQHHGTIVAENRAGGGACFIVTLPLNLRTGQLGHP